MKKIITGLLVSFTLVCAFSSVTQAGPPEVAGPVSFNGLVQEIPVFFPNGQYAGRLSYSGDYFVTPYGIKLARVSEVISLANDKDDKDKKVSEVMVIGPKDK